MCNKNDKYEIYHRSEQDDHRFLLVILFSVITCTEEKDFQMDMEIFKRFRNSVMYT